MNILILCTYFSPDTAIAAVRPYMLAKYLAQFGHQVTVLRSGLVIGKADDALPLAELGSTRVISYMGLDSPAEQYERGTRREVSSIGKSRISFLPSAIRLPIASFYHKIMRPIEFSKQQQAMKQRLTQQCQVLDALKGQSFDIVFSTYGELENVYAGAYAAKLFNCKWILDFRDPIAHHALTSVRECRKLTRIQTDAVNSADLCTAVSQGLADMLVTETTNVPIRVLRNGYNDKSAFSSTVKKEQDVLSFCYTGQLYDNLSTLEPLFHSIQQLGFPLERIKLHYAGPSFDMVRQQAEKYHVEQILVNHGYVSRNEVVDIQAQSDIFLVASWNLHNETGVMTGKFYEGIRNCSPILSIINGDVPNSELYQINEQYRCGFCYECCREETHFPQLCDYLRQAYEQKMETGHVEYLPVPELFTDFRYDSLARQLETIFQELTEG
ncbi:hypothetical protein [Pseudoflavonifractor phocaeensis]|uniref:hypothetical protein n=1 Tax=Pseudoflavonifractor phocaeensis TaxID=1870988 RepID=UPI001F422418|nr:hypothetical protein [Pseudoflavonifractor phocaeensis]MCF2661513.1 hypothetical protein [Pseudoflavonifractor phocaeensis]